MRGFSVKTGTGSGNTHGAALFAISSSMLSFELTRDSDKLISRLRWITIFGNSMSPASSPFTSDEDPGPNKATLTFFTSLPPPVLAGNSTFLLEPPCTSTSTRGSRKLGTSMLPAALAFVAFSLRRASNSSSQPMPYDLQQQ